MPGELISPQLFAFGRAGRGGTAPARAVLGCSFVAPGATSIAWTMIFERSGKTFLGASVLFRTLRQRVVGRCGIRRNSRSRAACRTRRTLLWDSPFEIVSNVELQAARNTAY